MRRRDLEDEGVLQRANPVHGSRLDAERGTRRHHLTRGRLLARGRELELRTTFEHVPRLVLLPVELQRELVPRLDVQELAGVRVSNRPNQLVAPRLLDPLG